MKRMWIFRTELQSIEADPCIVWMNNAAILASDEGCFKKTINDAPVLKCVLVNDVTDTRSLPKSQYSPH